MIGVDQSVTPLQLEDLINLSGVDQAVATHQNLIAISRSNKLIIMYNLNQVTAPYIVQASLIDGHADIWIIRWYQQLHRIFRRGLKG